MEPRRQVFFVAFLFWALPVFPWGMTMDDYSPKVLLALFLLGCCPAIAAVGLLAGSIAAQRREVLVAWASIYDESTGLRNREFFLERLELQCQLGRDLPEYRIGVILLTVEERALDGQKPQPTDDETFRRIGMHLVDQMRPSDLVAAISSTEMAVLVSAGSTASLGAIVSRVWRSVETRANELAGSAPRLLIRMGHASLDSVEPNPEMLLEAARSDLTPVYSGKMEAPAA